MSWINCGIVDAVKNAKLTVSILLIVLVLAVWSTLIQKGPSTTQIEAINIGWSSDTLQNFLKQGAQYFMKVDYMNSDQVNEVRGELPDLAYAHPENRNIWMLTWEVRIPSGTWLSLTQVIDDEAGNILYEGELAH